MTLYLSRLRLSRSPSARALSALLEPREAGRAADANHRLVWSAFAGDPHRKRDFLWRAEGGGAFTVLSARLPDAPDGTTIFDPPETKIFEPDLRPGDRLGFMLRANATRTVTMGTTTPRGSARKTHVDVVMDRLHALPGGTGERAAQRMTLAQQAALDWLSGQGRRHGFALAPRPDGTPDLTVADYSVVALPHYAGKRQGQPQFGVLDLAGTIAVTDPAAFLAALPRGFGRAKAFGCGLMLIRRAR